MDRYLKNYEHLVKWLNLLMHERISLKINIQLDKKSKQWIITSKGNNKKVKIKICNRLYILGYQKELCCGDISLKNKFFTSIHNKLPAPGLKTESFSNVFSKNELLQLEYDIFGLCFWMMNRSEELFLEDKYMDKHRRFDFRFSHAYKFGYLSRPLVDEWLQFLTQFLKVVYPNIIFNKSKFKISPSHDVDNPMKYSLISKKRIIKNFVVTFFTNPFEIIRFLFNKNYLVNKSFDPYDNFKWILDISDKYNLKNEFYFMSSSLNWRYDTGYHIDNPKIIELIKELNKRGHFIGLHPSYDVDLDNLSFLKQGELLRNILSKNGILQNKFGVRMHYLKFFHPSTSYQCIDSKFQYDSSLGYSEIPGFRCGTCKEFTLFDSIKNEILNLRERPLILMDSSLFSKNTFESEKIFNALKTALILKQKCLDVDGEFLFLWHNCQLETKEKKELYEALVRPLSK